MPTSITVVATSTSVAPAANASIAAAFSAEGIWPWMTPTANPSSSSARSRSASRSAALPCIFSDSLDQRADDEGLPPRTQLAAQELVGGRPFVLVHDAGLDRTATGRQLVQGGRVEVAVCRQRERARDRRRGHVQDVRRHPLHPLRVERPPLRDPEAVLLVDHAEAQAGELDVGLDQRVGADDDSQLAAREPIERFPAPCRGSRSGQQRKRSRLFGQQLPQRHRVLLGQASRSAPSAPPGSRLPAPAASSTARPRSSPTRPPPSAAAASARRSRDPCRSRRTPCVGPASARTAATRSSGRRRRPACRTAAPASTGGGSASASPESPGTGTALRRPAARGPARRPRAARGKCTARIASGAPASSRRTRSSAGKGSRTLPTHGIACSTHCLIFCAFSCSVAGCMGVRSGGAGDPSFAGVISNSLTRKPRLSLEPVSRVRFRRSAWASARAG